MSEATPDEDKDGSVEGEQDPWHELAASTRPESGGIVMKAVLGPAQPNSGSQAFPASDTDGKQWYVKAPNNPQGGQVLVTEYLVSCVGQLIGAPVCVVRPISISEDFAGYQVINGPTLQEGVASASEAVPDAFEMRPALQYRDQDDNARRHAGVFALYDWCWGDDPQWLVVQTDEHRLYSHDHGYYFPPGGANWTAESVAADVGVAHPLGQSPDGLDVDELQRLAGALDALEATDFVPILASVPASWPVTSDDLVAVGQYLQQRASQVATRMRDLHAKLEGA